MTTKLEIAVDRSIEIATETAEESIRKILLDLQDRTDRRVDKVNVDTRNFANCNVEIFLK